MGNNDSNTVHDPINRDEWEQVTQHDEIEFVTNKKSGDQGEIRTVTMNSNSSKEHELQIYRFRKKQNSALVKCFGAEALQKKGFCGNEQNFKVLTQRIVKTWPQMSQLSFNECLYALQQSLKGFETLYKKVGSFTLTKNMIGINEKGELKVWCSENFAENHPSRPQIFLQTTINKDKGNEEKEMVKHVISIIEGKCESGIYPVAFQQKIYENAQSFTQGRNYLQSFIKSKNYKIPNYIRLDRSSQNSHAMTHLQSGPLTNYYKEKSPEKSSFNFPQKMQSLQSRPLTNYQYTEKLPYNYSNNLAEKIQPYKHTNPLDILAQSIMKPELKREPTNSLNYHKSVYVLNPTQHKGQDMKKENSYLQYGNNSPSLNRQYIRTENSMIGQSQMTPRVKFV